MSDTDLFEWTPDELAWRGPTYRDLAFALVDGSPPTDWEDLSPVRRVLALVRWGDKEVIEDGGLSFGNSQYPDNLLLYALAIEAVMDPRLQLELGCLLLQRAQVREPPLCEHMYESSEFSLWEPETHLHEELSGGPLTWNIEATIRLALRAYGNAWDFYTMAGNNAGDFVRSLLALDGIRVCYEALHEPKNLSMLCSGLPSWLHGDHWKFQMGSWEGAFDEIVREVDRRFSKTAGRIEPMVKGRAEARERLWKEFEWFDSIPLAVADRLIDGEYESQMLVDPTHGRTAPVMSYALAAECMVQLLITRPIDGYLDKLPKQENDDFKQRFRKHNNKPWRRDLGMGVVVHNLTGSPSFQAALSHVGADIPYVLGELPGELSKLSDLRNDAAHGRGVFTEQQRALARAMTTKIVGELAKLSPMAAIQRGDRSDDG